MLSKKINFFYINHQYLVSYHMKAVNKNNLSGESVLEFTF